MPVFSASCKSARYSGGFIGQHRNNGMKQMRSIVSAPAEINAAQLIQQKAADSAKDFRLPGTVNREFTDHICTGGQGHTASGVVVCTGRGTTLNKVTTHHDKNQIGAGLPADFSELIGVPTL